MKPHMIKGEEFLKEKPAAAFALSLVGGLLVLLGGIGIFALFTEGFGVIREIFPVFGVIIIVGAIIMYTQPRFANAWGIAILILGMISLIGIITTLGGILSMIGGYLATAWKPGEREVERHNYRFRYNG
jgi:hypothetical protein